MDRPTPKTNGGGVHRLSRDGLSNLVGLAYESASSPDGWPVFLEQLAADLRGVAPALNLSGSDRSAGLWIAPEADAEVGRRYDEHYITKDVRRPLIQRLPEGSVFVGHELLEDAELVRTEFYNDFLRPQGYFHLLGGVPIKEPERLAVVRLVRRRRDRRFGVRERRLLGALMPHLARALRLHHEFAGLRAERDSARDALDRLRHGVVLLDQQGEVVALNERARLILEGGDGLSVLDGRLRASDPRAEAELAKRLAEAHAGEETCGVVRVPSASGERSLVLRVERLTGSIVANIAKRAVVAAFIDDPADHAPPPAELVSDALGLTVQQARIVRGLAAGRRVREIAAELGITYDTARVHLANARKRTGARAQKDLVRLVLALM